MALIPPGITSGGRATIVGALRVLTRFDPFGHYPPRRAGRHDAKA